MPQAIPNVEVRWNGTTYPAGEGDGWLQDRCNFWQRQLRLQDWDVTVEWAESNALGGAMGRTTFHASTHEARVRILPEHEYPPVSERAGSYDPEEVLVHELLHLTWGEWEGADAEDDPKHNAKELALNLTAAALVRLERGERR